MKMDESSDNPYSPSQLVSTFTSSSPPAYHPSIPFPTPFLTLPPVRIPFNPLQLVLLSLTFAILSLMTVAGNLFVIAAFRTEPSLRQPHNYFLLSLAVADLAVGAVSLPFFGTYVIYGYRWPMGSLACDLWLSIDYTMSSASAASLLLISLDRYYSIISPLTYRSLRTRKRVCIIITVAWIMSALVWCPGIFGYPYIYGSRIVPYDDCYIQFLKTNSFLTVITALFAFFIPVCIMVVLYFRIWRITEKRKKDLKVLMAIRPIDCGSDVNSKKVGYSKGLKKTQYFKIHCLRLRRTFGNRTKTNRKTNKQRLKTFENDQDLEIQEVEVRSSGSSEVQSQQELRGFEFRPEPTSNMKKHRRLKNIKKTLNCLKLSKGFKNHRTNTSNKIYSNVEEFRVKTEEIKRKKNINDLGKNNTKTGFNCLNICQGFSKRKMYKQSVSDFQNPKTREFELRGKGFREVKGQSEKVKLKTKPIRIPEKSKKVPSRAQQQKLEFNYLDLPESLKMTRKMYKTSLEDIGSIDSNESEDAVKDATVTSSELPQPKNNLQQETRRLGDLQKVLNNLELSECSKHEGHKINKYLKPREILDIEATEGLRETLGHFNCIFKSENTEMSTVEYDEDAIISAPSLKISYDTLGSPEMTETMNINPAIRNNEILEQIDEEDEILTEDKELILVSVITNESVRDFTLDERTGKTIRNKGETRRKSVDTITVSKSTDKNVSPSTSLTTLTKHICSINVDDNISENNRDLHSSGKGSLTTYHSDNDIRTCFPVSTSNDNRKYNNDITPLNCSVVDKNTLHLHTKGNGDSTETSNNEEKTQHHNKDSQMKNNTNTTKPNTTTHKNNSSKNNQQTTNHKKHTKTNKKRRRKKRPIKKGNYYRGHSSTAKNSQFQPTCCFEEGEMYTILINIPRGEAMSRPSIRLVSGSVDFDQWHCSVDSCENLNEEGGNITYNEWEESDFETESDSEMIDVWGGDENEDGGNNVNKEEFENINVDEWLKSEEDEEKEKEEVVAKGEVEDIVLWEKENGVENMEFVDLSRTSLETEEVLPDISRCVEIEMDDSNDSQNGDDDPNDDQYERVVTSLRESSDITTTGTGTGSDTIDTEPGTEGMSTNERGQKWRKGYSAHRRMRIGDRKAAKTLSAILLVFIVTWLPYNVFALLQAFCDDCVNETLYAIGYWLCYLNSTINPLCYALCNANFRKAFIRIVTCQRRQYHLHPGIYAHRGLHKRSPLQT